MKKCFQRARKPEEKEERSRHLLQVSRDLLEQGADLNTLSLNEIARNAKMAKANIYRYFETREALFLELLWDEWQTWFVEFQKEWKRSSRRRKGFEALVKMMASTLAHRKLLCALTTALPTVVEKNLSEETLSEFKRRSLLFFGEVARFLKSCSSDVSVETYGLFLQDTVSLISGIYPFAHPNEVVARVIAQPDLHFYKRDLETELARYMIALANDLKQKQKKK